MSNFLAYIFSLLGLKECIRAMDDNRSGGGGSFILSPD